MKVEVPDSQVREALHEIQRYLSDQIAPMMAADAARELLRLPPKYGASAIQHWLEGQLQAPDRAVTVSRFLFHAVKKFEAFSELQLIDAQTMHRYVMGLSRLVMQMCPERERAELGLKLSRIGEAPTALSDSVRFLNREIGEGGEGPDPGKGRGGPGQGVRKDGQAAALPASPYRSILMERLEELRDTGKPEAQQPETQDVLARLVGRAAVEAGNSGQFEAALESIRKLGVDPKFDRVFRSLGERLPGWDVDPAHGQPGGNSALGRLLQAMHQIVALAGTREEGMERFSEMLYAAIEQFNEGHLAQATSMFDVAQRLMEEKKVDTSTASLVRTRAEGLLSSGSLQQFASTSSKHHMLRRVLCFFPSYTIDSLLKALNEEPRRERRKLMLSLLEVHGPSCRPKLLDRLSSYLSGELPDEHGYYARNSVFLLRRIPLTSDDDQQREFELLAAFSRPDRPFMVTKEAVGSLAHLRLPESEKVLTDRLAEFEEVALSGTSNHGHEESLEMLDRTCAALAVLGTPATIRAVVDHAFRVEPHLGETLRRVRHLAGCDFFRNREEVERLVARLRKALPSKVLGVLVGRRVHEIPPLVRALAGAEDPSVRPLFDEIVRRFPDQEFTDAVREAIATPRVASAEASTTAQAMSGDLDVFGLPTLLQSISDTGQSGRLVISDSNGRPRALILVSSGAIARCEVGSLEGLDAVCQLFERPRPGTFRFEKAKEEVPVPAGEGGLGVMATILEAMRRHDEFNEARALVPDGASLMPTGSPPSVPEDETDQAVVKFVWNEAARGTAPESCEGSVKADAYRIRKLYAHWLEHGALKRRPAA